MKQTKSARLLPAAVAFVLTSSAVMAQAQGPQISVTRPSHFATSPRLPDLPDTAKVPFEDHEPLPLPARKGPPSQADGAVQAHGGPPARAVTRNNFDGIGANGSAPPDTNIAVGPNHVVEVVNSRYQIFNKAGTAIFGPASLSSLWTPLGGSCATANAGDPVVQYDRLADRWIITELGSLRSPYSECIAVSKTGDPTGQYYLYAYNFASNLNDYPKFGVWPTATNSAYTATYNLFANGSSFAGGQMCAYDRAAMLAGNASPASVCFTITTDGGFLPADLDGATPPLDGTPAYFLTWETSTSLRAYKLAPDFANPSASTLTQLPDLTVSSFVQACSSCVPQLGTTEALDTLSDRPMYRLAYRMFSDHASMVVNHTVTSGPGSITGVRWYELRTPLTGSGNFSVYQQSTFSPDATYRWMGSAAMDQAGNLAIGYSASSGSLNPALRYTGRNATDPLNTLQTEISIQIGTGSQTTGLSRWGDYAALRIDPSDDCTFWFSSEYEKTNGTFNWATYVGSFTFPTCGGTPAPDFTISASPASISLVQGKSGGSTINLTALNGYNKTVNLTVSGCPSGATCTLSPTAVAPTGSSSLSISTGTAAPGTYPLTVQGTDGTLTHSTSVGLTVQPKPDFSLSASPTSSAVNTGSPATSTITVTPVNGYNGTVTLSIASGCPSNATCSFSPGTAAPGAPSTLTVATTATTPAGTYLVTVTGIDSVNSLSHTTTFTVMVTVSTADFSIAASPTSLTAPQTVSKTSTVTLTSIGGFNSSVTLSTGSTCPGTCSFSPVSVTPNGSSTLTVTPSATTTPGTYTVVVTGSSATSTHSTSVTVTVVIDFSITAPAPLTVNRGTSGSASVAIGKIGSSTPVTLSISGLPTNVTASFAPNPASSGSSSTLTINAKQGAKRGAATVTITGVSGTVSHTVTMSLTIN